MLCLLDMRRLEETVGEISPDHGGSNVGKEHFVDSLCEILFYAVLIELNIFRIGFGIG